MIYEMFLKIQYNWVIKDFQPLNKKQEAFAALQFQVL